MKLIDQAVESIYALAGANSEDQFVFTSSDAESITQVFHSIYYDHMVKNGRTQFLLCNLEGSATLLNGARFEDLGCLVEQVSVNSLGLLTRDILNLHTTPKTGALFLSLSNPLTGVMQSLAEIALYCKEHEILLHLNISDCIGKTYFMMRDFPISYLSFSVKKGAGALFIKKGVEFKGMIPSSESLNPLRGGAIDEDLFDAFGKECQRQIDEMDQSTLHLAHLRDHFETTLQKEVPSVKPLYMNQMRVPHQSVALFPKVAADLLLFHLRSENILASLGGGSVQKLEHLLGKCGLDSESSNSALAFSFDVSQTLEQVEKMAIDIGKIYLKLEVMAQDLEEDEF
ncbi:MAG: aminotransferase class V-fold PLP-dependent enzyme [Rhabdochlamydiaceae bacterium]|nr:aminotransferase class V-fold PLP-dependent enzyme [Candidatus Amphrikana amoebophyrae]